jgi:hypothetical protein
MSLRRRIIPDGVHHIRAEAKTGNEHFDGKTTK